VSTVSTKPCKPIFPSKVRDVDFQTVRLEAVHRGGLFAVIAQCFAGQSVYEMHPFTSQTFYGLIGLAFIRGHIIAEPSLHIAPGSGASIN
jgi:hypothetical protein